MKKGYTYNNVRNYLKIYTDKITHLGNIIYRVPAIKTPQDTRVQIRIQNAAPAKPAKR